MSRQKKLHLNKQDKKIAGVCAGFADYFDIDVTIVRVLWICSVLCLGFGILPYIIFWLILPEDKSYDVL